MRMCDEDDDRPVRAWLNFPVDADDDSPVESNWSRASGDSIARTIQSLWQIRNR